MVDLRSGAALARPEPLALGDEVVAAVRSIVADVRQRGDAALFDLTLRFDGVDLSTAGLVATADEIAAAEGLVAPDVRDAIDRMIDRLRDLHARQLRGEWWEDRDGLRFGEIVRPVRRAGCYVPGGRASYPSTVAMTVVPAAVAGVEEITVATPPRPDGSIAPEVLYTARLAGAHRVMKAGGAQAIAALAYGTETISPVDIIVGPGNVYVTAAKREVIGDVGIDGLAGPTELVIVADETADPSLIAADLEAQAEHDPLASGTLVTTREELVERVPGVARQSRALLVRDLEHAADVANELAPEHLEVLVADPRSFLRLVRNAGAVFLGPWSAVPLGDYGVGSNHVLPTMATARFASGLRATDFVKVSAVVDVTSEEAARLAAEVAPLARAEGLEGHARALEARGADRGGSR